MAAPATANGSGAAYAPVPPLITWLGDTDVPTDALEGLLGGKGASLESLIRRGAPTPPGFCLTTAAFRAQLEAGADGVAAALAALPDEAARAALTERLLGDPLSPALVDGLADALAQLAGRTDAEPRFAVRSSAVGEDGAAASFAGIHETELELSADQVADAVRRCWASLWSRRAVDYRIARGLAMDGAMAVVVQVLVPAEASAVLFTRHPITRHDDQLLINAVRGLGEALVSGLVTPDEIVVDRHSLAAIELQPGDGGRVLDDEQLRGLTTLGLRLEAEFGMPLDIEAALAGGTWHVLQARPITA